MKAIGQKDVGLLLFYNALVYTAFYCVTSSAPFLFEEIYGFNDLQIGLSFLPFGFGCLLAPIIGGKLQDWNYRRVAKQVGITVDRKRGDDLRHFPLERARIEVAVPLLFVGDAALLCYGEALEVNASLAAPLVLHFVMGLTFTGAFNTISVMLVDLYPLSPSTATAANNLVRCLMGATGTAVIIQMIRAMGRGWSFTFVAAVVAAASPILWVLVRWGPKWRDERGVKLEKKGSTMNQQPTLLVFKSSAHHSLGLKSNMDLKPRASKISAKCRLRDRLKHDLTSETYTSCRVAQLVSSLHTNPAPPLCSPLMPLRPFPYPFRVGIDICHIPRIRQIVTRDTLRAPDSPPTPTSFFRLLNHVLTAPEQHQFWRRWKCSDEIFTGKSKNLKIGEVARWLAGRWAAKEAVVKACGPARVGFGRVLVMGRENGEPFAVVCDEYIWREPLEDWVRRFGGKGLPKEMKTSERAVVGDADESWQEEGEALEQFFKSGLDKVPRSSYRARQAEYNGTRQDELGSDVRPDGEQTRDSRPRAYLAMQDVDFDELHGQIARLSISHDSEYATAVCLAAIEPMQGDVGGEAAAREGEML